MNMAYGLYVSTIPTAVFANQNSLFASRALFSEAFLCKRNQRIAGRGRRRHAAPGEHSDSTHPALPP